MATGEHYLNCTEEEMLAQLDRVMFPDFQDLYEGPGAFSASELVELTDATNHQNARSRARRAVKQGQMIEVSVKRFRSNGGAFKTAAWVLKSTYEKWMAEQAE